MNSIDGNGNSAVTLGPGAGNRTISDDFSVREIALIQLGTVAAPHAAGATVGYWVDVPTAIMRFFAHEAVHAWTSVTMLLLVLWTRPLALTCRISSKVKTEKVMIKLIAIGVTLVVASTVDARILQ